MNPGNASAKNAILPKVTDKSIEVLSQHARYQMRHIQGGLACPKFAGYLWLLWVASHRNKIVRLTILFQNDHSILIALLHIDWQVLASWWQNNWDICCSTISILFTLQVLMPLNMIMRSAVRYQLCLILYKMLKPLAFNFELLIQLAVFLKWVEASTNCQFICAKLFCGDFMLTSHLVFQQYALVPFLPV